MTLAFVFPGQGSQTVGMLDGFAADYPVVRETLDEASSVLGYDLAALISENPEGRLDQTEYTQPALLTASVAIHRAWLAEGGAAPDFAAGHSLGEYSALVVAGAIDFATAVALVRERGRFMQEGVPAGEGSMAAVLGLEDAVVERVCERVSSLSAFVAPANYNAPGQVVIAGHAAAVDAALAGLKEAGARRAVRLAVSVPSHTLLMRPAAERLAVLLNEVDFRLPTIPVLQNVDGRAREDVASLRAALAEQLYRPVRWTDTIRHLAQACGVDLVHECGPGRVLGGLISRIEPGIQIEGLATPEHLRSALKAMQSPDG
jgi:[acyl-carrier-protein] S-malonyltransferase